MDKLIAAIEQAILALDLAVQVVQESDADPQACSLMVESAQLLMTLTKTLHQESQKCGQTCH